MMLAYWISPNGEIIEIEIHPVKTILQNPGKYGYRVAELQMIYAKYSDANEMEGEATKAVIRDLLVKGWVYAHRRDASSDWSLEVEKLDKRTRFIIQLWSQSLVALNSISEEDIIRIHRYHRNLKSKVTVEDALQGEFFR